MTARSYYMLSAQGMALYSEQKYAEALDLLTREGNDFPEQAAEIAYLRWCMAVRIGKPELAVAILDEALQRGYWYSEEILRHSPSWQTLQGKADFERVAAICKEREVAEHPESRAFIREPESGLQAGQHYPLVIALHGGSDTAACALAGWQAVTAAGWLLAAIQSSQMIWSDTYGWFDGDRAIREITEQYASLCEQYPIDTGRVILAGFSAGGELALRLSLEGILPARGFILLSPAVARGTGEAWLQPIQRGAVRRLRGYMLLGAEDVNVPQDEIRALVGLLNSHGVPCGFETIPNMGHAYPAENASMLKRALAFIKQEA